MTANDTTSNCHVGFHVRQDGILYCDDVKVNDLHRQLVTSQRYTLTSPVFVYSRRQLERNVRQFYEAFKSLPVPAKLNFSMKSNHNFHILKLLQSLGCGVTLVSGMEQRVASEAGFEPENMLLNGSGKSPWEIEAAVSSGALLNVDSEFDLYNIKEACQHQRTEARVLLRLNLDIDPKVHKYVSTGKAGSKFGLDPASLSRVVHELTSEPSPLHVVGLHCHLGSTIKDTNVFRESVKRLLTIRQDLLTKGLTDLRIINVGGGLNIDYTRYKDETHPFREESEDVQKELGHLRDHLALKASAQSDGQLLFREAAECLDAYSKERISRAQFEKRLHDVLDKLGITADISTKFPSVFPSKESNPTPADLVKSLADVFVTPRDDDVTLLFEPGRAIVGNTGMLLTTVLGCKTTGNSRFLVVDGAMTDAIRPSLYGAYHHISIATPPPGDGEGTPEVGVVDVVGPVCESADFLGKNRLLPLPASGACAVVHDVGAYCASMGSNYNLRMRPAEVMVNGAEWQFIRRPDTMDDLLAPYKI